MKIISMDECSPDQVVDIFNRGFEDYLIPVTMDERVLQDYVRINDISLGDSFLAFDDRGRPQAFTFTGIRGTHGWIGGLAVDPEHRGMGYGRAVFDAQMSRVKELGLTEIWLECIDSNEAGLKMYGKAGFKRTGKVWFVQLEDPGPWPVDRPEMDSRFSTIREVLPNYDPDHIWPKASRSLEKISGAYVKMAVRDGETMAYIIAFPHTENTYLWDLTPNKYGEALLCEMLGSIETERVTMANLHKRALLSMLQDRGFVITITLIVMRRKMRKGLW